jgi:hypothetical protein
VVWILPLAPGVPERLIVGNERAFLTWFFDRDEETRKAVDPDTLNEYLRTFTGEAGVLGALGVYRAAFTTIAQTEPLTLDKVQVPVVAMGGIEPMLLVSGHRSNASRATSLAECSKPAVTSCRRNDRRRSSAGSWSSSTD